MRALSDNYRDQFVDYIRREKLFAAGDHLLLAVSGGVDSMLLARLCSLAGFNFSLLHCNFQLRGDESKRDEEFVQVLARELGVECRVRRFDTNAYALEKPLFHSGSGPHIAIRMVCRRTNTKAGSN